MKKVTLTELQSLEKPTKDANSCIEKNKLVQTIIILKIFMHY